MTLTWFLAIFSLLFVMIFGTNDDDNDHNKLTKA